MSNPNRSVVERDLPLSQSFIWNLQAKFYESLGIDAWLSGVVPSKITCNSFIARSYARQIAAYLSDVDAENVTILDLGAGHGRFGFLCVQHLREMMEAGLLKTKNWRYVLTDVAERNVEYWQQHEALIPLAEEGLLDFARFEAGVDTGVDLRYSGDRIDAENKTEHLVLVANYFFDSLPIDYFQVKNSELFEGCPVLSVSEDADCDDKKDSAIIKELKMTWETRPAAEQPYDLSELNELIKDFQYSLGDTAFNVPIGSIETIQTLDAISENGSCIITADKGYTHRNQLQGKDLPSMVQHGSCFSFSVNFSLLGEWITSRGGFALHPKFRDGALEVSTLVTQGKIEDYPNTQFAYSEGAGHFSPSDFRNISRKAADQSPLPDLRHCLSLIRLSSYEPNTLYTLRRAIRRQISDASDREKEALLELLPRVANLYFHMDDDRDIPFAIGQIYQKLGNYDLAIPFFQDSIKLFGDDEVTWLNLSICLFHSDQKSEAAECLEKSLELSPSFEKAHVWKQKMANDLEKTDRKPISGQIQ